MLGLLDPLAFIIDQEISDGSDAFTNSSDADKDVVRRGRAFVVGTYLFYYGTLRHTLMLQLRAGSLGRTVTFEAHAYATAARWVTGSYCSSSVICESLMFTRVVSAFMFELFVWNVCEVCEECLCVACVCL